MNQKGFSQAIIIFIVVGLIIIGAVGYFAFLKKPVTQSPISTLKDSESVCRYIHQDTQQLVVEGTKIPFIKCNNYICGARDEGVYWDISYRCPGPSNFPMGQGYSLEINKASGSIKVMGATN